MAEMSLCKNLNIEIHTDPITQAPVSQVLEETNYLTLSFEPAHGPKWDHLYASPKYQLMGLMAKTIECSRIGT